MPELTPSTREAARASASVTPPCARQNRPTASPASRTASGTLIRPGAAWWRPPIPPAHLASGAGAEGTPFARLKVAQLALKVEAQRLSLDETKRCLLDVNEANAALDEIGSTMRDALLNWPARVSGLIAAEMGVDPHLLQTILQSHINDLLTEAADRFDPAGLGGDRAPQP